MSKLIELLARQRWPGCKDVLTAADVAFSAGLYIQGPLNMVLKEWVLRSLLTTV